MRSACTKKHALAADADKENVTLRCWQDRCWESSRILADAICDRLFLDAALPIGDSWRILAPAGMSTKSGEVHSDEDMAVIEVKVVLAKRLPGSRSRRSAGRSRSRLRR
jgi:hypothetical protein